MGKEEQILRLLETSSGNPLDIHYTLYTEFLAKSENPGKLLRIILEYSDDIGNVEDDAPTCISERDVVEYLSANIDLIAAITKNIIDQNLSVEEFYKKLYNNLFVLDILPHQDKDQSILLYTLSSNKVFGLPYYCAENLLKMSDEQYNKIIDSIEDKISLAVYMLNRRFDSKTEEISQLWNIASSLQSREEQIVFWAVIISVIRRFERKSNDSSGSVADD